MIKIEKTTFTLDEGEMIELERIEIDLDAEAALKFLRKVIYRKAELSQRACCGVKLEDTESHGGNVSH